MRAKSVKQVSSSYFRSREIFVKCVKHRHPHNDHRGERGHVLNLAIPMPYTSLLNTKDFHKTLLTKSAHYFCFMLVFCPELDVSLRPNHRLPMARTAEPLGQLR